MRFNERKQYLYDPEIFKKSEAETAQAIYDEYVRMHSAKPTPVFLEVDRSPDKIDKLWHVSINQYGTDVFSRRLEIYAINRFNRPFYTTRPVTKQQRGDRFILSHVALKNADYFPMRGDMVFWNGYRLEIVEVIVPDEAYWHQTGVWNGLEVGTSMVAEGDAPPMTALDKINPSEEVA